MSITNKINGGLGNLNENTNGIFRELGGIGDSLKKIAGALGGETEAVVISEEENSLARLKQILADALEANPDFPSHCYIVELMAFGKSIEFNGSKLSFDAALTSDGTFLSPNTSGGYVTHEWDLSKDIVMEDGTKTRWIIFGKNYKEDGISVYLSNPELFYAKYVLFDDVVLEYFTSEDARGGAEFAIDASQTLLGVGFTEKTTTDYHTSICFQYNKALRYVKLPEGITNINSAFSACTALQQVELPSTIERFYGGDFDSCRSLQRIKIPLNAIMETSGNDTSFWGCASLSYVEIEPNHGSGSDSALNLCGLLLSNACLEHLAQNLCDRSGKNTGRLILDERLFNYWHYTDFDSPPSLAVISNKNWDIRFDTL